MLGFLSVNCVVYYILDLPFKCSNDEAISGSNTVGTRGLCVRLVGLFACGVVACIVIGWY